MKTKEANIS